MEAGVFERVWFGIALPANNFTTRLRKALTWVQASLFGGQRVSCPKGTWTFVDA